jgi:hypothetical protein
MRVMCICVYMFIPSFTAPRSSRLYSSFWTILPLSHCPFSFDPLLSSKLVHSFIPRDITPRSAVSTGIFDIIASQRSSQPIATPHGLTSQDHITLSSKYLQLPATFFLFSISQSCRRNEGLYIPSSHPLIHCRTSRTSPALLIFNPHFKLSIVSLSLTIHIHNPNDNRGTRSGSDNNSRACSSRGRSTGNSGEMACDYLLYLCYFWAESGGLRDVSTSRSCV